MIPVAEKLFTWPSDDPRLIAGRRRDTGKLVFPFPAGPEARDYEEALLAPVGTLWSYTVQRFPPKAPPFAGPADPTSFEPYAVGYVELAGELIVECRLHCTNFAALRVGAPMRLTIVPFGARTAAGEERLTYAFEPVGEPT